MHEPVEDVSFFMGGLGYRLGQVELEVKVLSGMGLKTRETALQVVFQSCAVNGTDVACHHKRRRRSRDSDVEVADDTEVIRGDSAGHRV